MRTRLLPLVLSLAAFAEPASKLSIYSFNLPDIKGKLVSFEQFKGKVLLLVNVASKSNFTPQYKGLETIYEKYGPAGLVVLGFPSNDFGTQEPEPEAVISAFCESTYHVTFPLFSKLAVRGDDITPLFAYLTKEANPKLKGPVQWNFTKFLIDRKGQLTARFDSDVEPDDPDLLVAVESALEGKKETSPRTPPGPPEESHSRRPRDGR